ncbi:MAG: autotransporter-associated beta strand repeat-containing protein [Pirellulales bacterium]|nr:autotransporter-associated beta strand repeat-containing protein [Pirellulales bacterium]
MSFLLRTLACCFLLVGVMAMASSVPAADIWWDGDSGTNLRDPLNWEGDNLPGTSDKGYTQSYTTTMDATQPDVTMDRLYIGKVRTVGTPVEAYFYMTGGNVSCGNDFILAYGNSNEAVAVGVLKISGGTLRTTLSSGEIRFSHGECAGAYAWLEMTGGTIQADSSWIIMGSNNDNVCDQTAGSLKTVNSILAVGRLGCGVYNLSGGTAEAATVTIAERDFGFLNVSGTGTMTSSGTVQWGGAAYVGKAYANLAIGGTIAMANAITSATVANGGEAFLNFHGGTLKPTGNHADFLALPTATGGIFVGTEGGTIDTDGHDVTITQAIQKLSGSGLGSITVDIAGSAYVGPPVVKITTDGDGHGATAIANMVDDGAGGLKVDSFTITNPGEGYEDDPNVVVTLSGGGLGATAATGSAVLAVNGPDGGLVKKGSGTLTLAGVNTYEGLTDVQAGMLAVTGTVAGDVDVQVGAALGGTGTIGGSVLAAGGTIVAPGMSIGTLVVSGNAELAGTLDVEFDSSTDEIDLLAVNGQLDLTGATIAFTDLAASPEALDQPAYVFATYSTLVGDLPTVLSSPSGYTVDFAYNGNSIALVVPEPASLVLLAGLVLGVLCVRRRK